MKTLISLSSVSRLNSEYCECSTLIIQNDFYMKKNILILCAFLVSLTMKAQIITTTNQSLPIYDSSNSREYLFSEGDTVSIYGYKKKGDVYYFAVVNNDFAKVISNNVIPFNVEEKQLKKLPNALGDAMKSFIYQKKCDIIESKKNRYKQDALNGKIHFVVGQDNIFVSKYGAKGYISGGDTIFILGYSGFQTSYEYAIYSNNAVGVFIINGSENFIKKKINIEYLPPVEDKDVKMALVQKEKEYEQKQKEIITQYRKDALAGKIKGIVTGSLTSDDFLVSPFEKGDVVSIVGYSKKENKDYYAVYSDKMAGVFKASVTLDAYQSNEQLKHNQLPAVDDPEVTKVLTEQITRIDSLQKNILAEQRMKLSKLQQSLIEIYKENDPIMIYDIVWFANSVGGIEVDLKIINCSVQTIKYITFNGYFLNAVGDKCRNEIGGGTTWSAKGIGPIGPRPTSQENCEERMDLCEGSYNFDNLTFYSRVADSFKLSSVTIQYMNGKTITLSGSKLDNHIRYKYPN